MKQHLFALFSAIFVLLFASACTKMDPNAYKGDPVLQDYQAQLQATTAEFDALTKQAADAKKEMETSAPQSGQATIHKRRLDDMKNRLDKLSQQIQFWKIRIESRAKEAQIEYAKAFTAKKPWPDSQKVQAYYQEKRLRQAKINWDQKQRIEEYEKSSQPGHGNGHGEPASTGH